MGCSLLLLCSQVGSAPQAAGAAVLAQGRTAAPLGRRGQVAPTRALTWLVSAPGGRHAGAQGVRGWRPRAHASRSGFLARGREGRPLPRRSRRLCSRPRPLHPRPAPSAPARPPGGSGWPPRRGADPAGRIFCRGRHPHSRAPQMPDRRGSFSLSLSLFFKAIYLLICKERGQRDRGRNQLLFFISDKVIKATVTGSSDRGAAR